MAARLILATLAIAFVAYRVPGFGDRDGGEPATGVATDTDDDEMAGGSTTEHEGPEANRLIDADPGADNTDDPDSTDDGPPPTAGAEGAADATVPGTGVDIDAEPTSSVDRGSVEDGVGPDTGSLSLRMELDDHRFHLTGDVPSRTVAEELGAVVDATYGPFGSTDLSIDATLDDEAWLAPMPAIVENFALMLDGSLEVNPNGVALVGRAPDRASVDLLVDAVDADAGFPPTLVERVEIVTAPPAEVAAVAAGGILRLEGAVPNDTVRDAIIGGAVELYGEGNVVDEVVVDTTMTARFELVRLADHLAVYQGFGDYSLVVRSGTVHGTLSNGVGFGEGGSRLSGRAQSVLAEFPALIARHDGRVVVLGHTDDVGTDAANVALSEARAAAVAERLVELGIDRDRLVVEGLGEVDPIAPNSTPAGRAANRRVEIVIGVDA